MSINKKADPTFSTKVSPEEKKAAKEVRALFEEFLKTQENLTSHLTALMDGLNNTKDTSNIQKISPLLKRYIHKYRDLCNEYIVSLEKAVQYTAGTFKDADMNNIRDLVVESVRDIRNNSKELIAEFSNIENDDFVKKVKDIGEKITKRLEQLEETVSEELFGHIDYNILGKIRLSFNEVPLSIKQGTNTKI